MSVLMRLYGACQIIMIPRLAKSRTSMILVAVIIVMGMVLLHSRTPPSTFNKRGSTEAYKGLRTRDHHDFNDYDDDPQSGNTYSLAAQRENSIPSIQSQRSNDYRLSTKTLPRDCSHLQRQCQLDKKIGV
ncbi:hypothetical protein EJ08DRAFT_134094 [Tothia fuscella]|uniref:Uncharacterized protein n=1 Tax=Tothia fuscella TaxID=1048955 RepID=A0A9P4NVG0_9PEZI|nr:hypothetical protein EJ08DRAFT_134094 [Tothia fuscella]